ncbi:MAG: PKD domain-containing protein [Bacteroidetes bacterium]|nr:MAG: PKD domain-containing protein [Bacteroidota bacterium]
MKYYFKRIFLALLFLGQAGFVLAQTADFYASAQVGCANFSVSFYDQSNPTPTSWSWDFGNGSTSSSQNPSAIYTSPGMYTVTMTVTYSSGQIAVTKMDYIRVYTRPTANFSTPLATGCQPFNASFNNNSSAGSAPLRAYLWDFGNGVTSTAANPTFLYGQAGTYNVSLQVEDTNGCTHLVTKSSFITAQPKPSVTFSSSSNTSCSYPHIVALTNTSIANTGGNMTYQWDLGNGQTTGATNPSIQYALPGQYTVRLIGTNSLGCKDTMTRANYVDIQDLQADFTTNKFNGCPPFVSSFTNLTTPALSGAVYEWTFGNGVKSSSKDTAVRFVLPGTYDVKMKVISATGCSDSVIRTAYITAYNKPNANFTVNDSAACTPPLNAIFQNNSGGVASYQWTFGDGTTSAMQNPFKSYSDTGLYTVSLVLQGVNGCTDTAVRQSLMKIRRPKADFRPNLMEGCAPLTVDFSNTSVSVAPLASISYRFGDGTISNNPFPKKTFNDTGLYNPWIRIVTDDGCIDSAMYDTIGVGMKPTANFIADTFEGCRNLEVQFINLTNVGNPGVIANSWEWQTGAGAARFEFEPLVQFRSESKPYDILLIAKHHGCADSLKKDSFINILDPTARFIPTSSGCNGDLVTFTNQSVGGTSFFWDFGDGDTSNNYSEQHQYNAGAYNALLIVNDSVTGCIDSMESFIFVASNDNLKFRADTIGCTRQGVWFFDQTPGSSGWEWRFSDGQVFNSRNVFVQFAEPGFYDVTFSAVVQGCRTSTTKLRYLHIYGPSFDIQTNPDPVCVPENKEMICYIGGERPIQNKIGSLFAGTTLLQQFPNIGDTAYHHFTQVLQPQDSVYYMYYQARDTAGCLNFKFDTIQAYRPNVRFTETQYGSCDGVLFNYQTEVLDSTSPQPLQYHWDFDDGTRYTIDSLSAEHLFTQSALRNVRLIAEDGAGCKDTVNLAQQIELKPISAAFASSGRQKNCPPFFVRFADTSSNTYQGINEWSWSFSDGSFAQVQNPSKLFVEPGKYWVALRVTDTLGCTDSIFQPDFIEVGGTKISYTFDVTSGCEPLLVEIKSQANGTAEIKWDMGDGKSIIDSANFIYSYTNAGRYQPIAFVKDNNGCQYNLPAIDTVNVTESPSPDFLYTAACLGSPANFTNVTTVFGNNIRYFWDFGTGDTSSAESPNYIFPAAGDYTVKLRAENDSGCGQNIAKDIVVPVVNATLSLDASRSCSGEDVKLSIDNSGIGRTIQVAWRFDDGSSLTNADSVWNHAYPSKGIYKPWAIVLNEYGCYDTTAIADSVTVGDNFPPASPFVYHATVIDDYSTGIRFEPINSIDFSRYILYRENAQGQFDSVAQLKVMSDTLFVDNVPTLHQPYRYKVKARNFCGHASSETQTVAHRTVEVTASTSDDASFLQWNAYEGWPVSKYDIYRLNEFGDYVWIKEVPGNRTEAYDSAIVCNRGYYYKVNAVGTGTRALSWSDSSGAIPNYIPFVPENELLSASILKENQVEVRWTETKGGKVPVDSYVLLRSRDGISYAPLPARIDDNSFSHVDRVDSAFKRSYYYQVMAKDSCGYFAKPSNYGRTMMLTVSMDSIDRPKLDWMPYAHWDEGVDIYRIEILNETGFEYVDEVHGSRLTYIDKKTDLNGRRSYIYRVVAVSTEDGGKESQSNPAPAQVRTRIYVPNAFHPGGQEDNHTFRPKGMYVMEYELNIINRWGQTLFTSDSMDKDWDGTFEGTPVMEGQYFYVINYKGTDGLVERLKGSVYLLR